MECGPLPRASDAITPVGRLFVQSIAICFSWRAYNSLFPLNGKPSKRRYSELTGTFWTGSPAWGGLGFFAEFGRAW